MKKVRILGIESSCDETSVSVIERSTGGKVKILSNIVKSQLTVHKNFGGVVPELAARAHSEIIDEIILMALKKAKIKFEDLNAIAATSGPGLLGGLLVGVVAAKTLSSVLNIPFIAINHLEGHALSVHLEKEIEYPYLLLLVSGGHTEFTIINKFNSYKRIGTTLDDALGEAFDKTARLLNLGYPGGPEIEKYAKKGNKNRFKLPQPLINEKNCHFSFSGLKSSIAQIVHKNKIDLKFKKDMSASFQKCVGEILTLKINGAIKELYKNNNKNLSVSVVGGVANNDYIKKCFKKIEEREAVEFIYPPKYMMNDNAAMIAWATILKHRNNHDINFKPNPRLNIE